METCVYHRQKSGWDFKLVNRRQTQKRMRLILEKSRWDFRSGNRDPGLPFTGLYRCMVWKVLVGFLSGKAGKGNQATNAKKDAFNAWKVRVGLYPG